MQFTMKFQIIAVVIIATLLGAYRTAPVQQQQTDLLTSIQDIQRKFSTSNINNNNNNGNVRTNDQLPTVETAASTKESTTTVAPTEKAEKVEDARQTKEFQYSKDTESVAADLNARQNKMYGYYGYYPQFAPQMPPAAYYPPQDYYDDFSGGPYGAYSSYPGYAGYGAYDNYLGVAYGGGLGGLNYGNLGGFNNYGANGLDVLNNLGSTGFGNGNLNGLNGNSGNNPQLASLSALGSSGPLTNLNAGQLTNYNNLGNVGEPDQLNNYSNMGNAEEEEILSRTSQGHRRRPQQNFKNSPIYYIRLPPTPYMFVPGLGYISQPPTITPMQPMSPIQGLGGPPPVVSPFYNIPLNFLANGKPSNIYQWGGNGYGQSFAQPQYPQFGMPYPPPRPQRPYQRPFIQDSKITHLKGPFLFNGRPEDIFLLQNSFNPIYPNPLNGYY